MHLNVITPSGTLEMWSGNCISRQKELLTMSINDVNSLAYNKWNYKYIIKIEFVPFDIELIIRPVRVIFSPMLAIVNLCHDGYNDMTKKEIGTCYD